MTTTNNNFPMAIQIYSVRSLMTERFQETLRALAGIGFKNIEWSGTFGGMPPKQLAEFLGQLDLNVMGMHAGAPDLLSPTSIIYQYAQALKPEFLTVSLHPAPDNLFETTAQLRRMRQIAGDRGFALTYHNHAHEFQKMPDGRLILDAMIEETAADNQQFLFDVFFAYYSKLDPCAYFERYTGRIPAIHFNDLDAGRRADADPARAGMDISTELGAGCMDLPAIYRAAIENGVRWIILEQHKLRENPLDSARRNFEYMHDLRATRKL